ncbi:hypothetical protein QBC34DRAFT_68520 [Podospora aff. communis PSN243]|uniref:Uncharacterized protein n=1 Tax=Podospora aff. communis PSN243 TaxID=3040156 RepID=A0AAV9H6M1_9PEZI|nr:hypothetical protein QBC34DRAFT_68520 [Podospora aff. communis PSN243]
MASGGVSGSSSAFRTSQRQPSYMTQASSSSSVMGDTFTPQMRDRQSRGKDPYHSGEGSEGSDLSDRETSSASRLRLGSSRVEKEDFSRAERRSKAEAYLGSPELLMMYAQSTEDSMAGARLHFTRMLCGYENEDDLSRGGSTRKSGSHPQPPPRDSDKRRGGDRASTR